MLKYYSSPKADLFAVENGHVLCQSAGLTGFTGPEDFSNPSDTFNYNW